MIFIKFLYIDYTNTYIIVINYIMLGETKIMYMLCSLINDCTFIHMMYVEVEYSLSIITS